MIYLLKGTFFIFTFLFITSCKDAELAEMNLSDDLLEPIKTESESTEVGNGGDLIKCGFSSPKFMVQKNGWYTLDYAELDKIRPTFLGQEGQLLIVRSRVSEVAPELVDSFQNFLASVNFVPLPFAVSFTENSSIAREWIPVESNEDISDESKFVVSHSCVAPLTRKVTLHQVVVRKEVLNAQGEVVRVRYYYDPILIGKLQNSPLQMSMLLVHEWLWDLFPDNQSKRLRIANRLLHAENNYPREFIRKALLLNPN